MMNTWLALVLMTVSLFVLITFVIWLIDDLKERRW